MAFGIAAIVLPTLGIGLIHYLAGVKIDLPKFHLWCATISGTFLFEPPPLLQDFLCGKYRQILLANF